MMTIAEARALLDDPLWPRIRDRFLETGSFVVYPKGDIRRLAYLDEATRKEIALWKDALLHVPQWRTMVDGNQVRALAKAYPGVYPEVFRYAAYFQTMPETPEQESAFVFKLLRLKFPEAYALCCS